MFTCTKPVRVPAADCDRNETFNFRFRDNKTALTYEQLPESVRDCTDAGICYNAATREKWCVGRWACTGGLPRGGRLGSVRRGQGVGPPTAVLLLLRVACCCSIPVLASAHSPCGRSADIESCRCLSPAQRTYRTGGVEVA